MKAKHTVRVLLNLFLLAVLVVSAGSFFLVEDLSSIFTDLAQNPYFSPIFFLFAHMLTGIFLFPSGILRAAGGSFFGLWYGLLVNLVGSAVLYIRFLSGRGPFTRLERWQTDYLPVYAVWAAIVVIVFPPLFGFI